MGGPGSGRLYKSVRKLHLHGGKKYPTWDITLPLEWVKQQGLDTSALPEVIVKFDKDKVVIRKFTRGK